MPEFSAQDVKRLRDATGAGMMDAKRALTDADGDFDKATALLRERGLGKAAERADRDNADGLVAAASSDTVGVLVEVKTETDFTAKSPQVIAFADGLAQRVLEKGEAAVDEMTDALDDLKITIKENIEVGRVVRFEAAAGNALDAYLHMPSGPPSRNGVLVEVAGGDAALAHMVALHISFGRPSVLNRDEFSAEDIEAEREAILAETKNEGKPEQAWPKIVEGKLNGWFKRTPAGALNDQPYIHDEKQSVEKAIGDAKVVRFAQIEIGA
ncbi:MAG TPA: translation elongation factor Ts [Acidimicrobiales bacterium]|nr:translation elongation factor Ts [Acidimicrobiales bacterium]